MKQPPMQEHLETPETGRAKEGSSSRNFGGRAALLIPWLQTSGPKICERINAR